MSDFLFPSIVDQLRAQFSEPLPGLDAQRRMAPIPRKGWRPTAIPNESRMAAVLVLLYPSNGEAHLPLTLRASHLPHHAGQVSLPGGAVEIDETVDASALREASEEVGIDPTALQIAGHLTPLHIPVSGYVLHPVVAVAQQRPSFVPSAHEVARVLDVPIAALCDPRNIRLQKKRHDGRRHEIPYFLVEGERVWGATAMVLSELLTLLGCPPLRPVEPDEMA